MTNHKTAQFTLIANVPYDTVRQDLVAEFRRFGRVELAMVVCDEASRHPHREWTSTAGYAFVRFSRRSEAAAAIQAAGMGLVSIRGVRVRADWARKDSYAKRGRVSAQQGAPLMSALGVPDGIQAMRSYGEEVWISGEQQRWDESSESTAADVCGIENNSPADVLCARLADLIQSSVKVNEPGSSSTTGSLSPSLASSLPQTTETTTCLPGFDDMLSPCSRGLLAQALSDVTSLRCDTSPDFFGPKRPEPAALLRAAVDASAKDLLT